MKPRINRLWKLLKLAAAALKRPPLDVVRDVQELLRLVEEWLVKRRGRAKPEGDKQTKPNR